MCFEVETKIYYVVYDGCEFELELPFPSPGRRMRCKGLGVATSPGDTGGYEERFWAFAGGVPLSLREICTIGPVESAVVHHNGGGKIIGDGVSGGGGPSTTGAARVWYSFRAP